MKVISRDATFSDDRAYRYSLRRILDNGSQKKLVVALLNPSVANEERDDPTTTFMLKLADRTGHGLYEAVNCFALVGTDPKCLQTHDAPIGPRNNEIIRLAAESANTVLIAWGNGGAFKNRASHVLDLLAGRELMCFGRTKSGFPRFPRALPSSIELQPYRVAA